MGAEVVISMAASLDGRIADAEGTVRWLDAYPASEFEFEAFIAGVGAIIMGRNSYEAGKKLGPWPYQAVPCMVLTHRPGDTGLPFIAFQSCSVRDAVAQLRERTHGVIWIMGGAEVARQALEEDVVDRIDLAIVPEILGAGPVWLPNGRARPRFKALRSRVCNDGAVQVSMVRA